MILFFGGSFNPPHRGHKNIVRHLLTIFPRDRIFITPNFRSPLKNEKDFLPEQVLKLCKLEFEEEIQNGAFIWEFELYKKEPSFTFESLQYLKDQDPNGSIGLVIGEDSLENFSHWYRYKDILSLVDLVVIFRRTTEQGKEVSIPDYFPVEKLKVLENELWKFQSSDLRKNRIKTLFSSCMKTQTLEYLDEIGYFNESDQS